MRIIKTQRSKGGRIKKLGNQKANVSSRPRIGGENFSEKLQALKSLLPTKEEQSRRDSDVEEDSSSGETEQLFQETADYIVRLRTQVVMLQKLIKIYGSSDKTEDNFVL